MRLLRKAVHECTLPEWHSNECGNPFGHSKVNLDSRFRGNEALALGHN